jgi:hypothetical protein
MWKCIDYTRDYIGLSRDHARLSEGTNVEHAQARSSQKTEEEILRMQRVDDLISEQQVLYIQHIHRHTV